MFVTTVVLLGATVAIAAAIVAYPEASFFAKGILVVACVIALASIYHEGLLWERAWIEYKDGNEK